MGDSDDEYDRRRVRDKFRGERSEYEQRRPRGDYRERRDWGDRRPRDSWSGGGRDQNWDRKRGGQYYGRARRDSEGGEGQMSPPMKRNRRDWDASYDKGMNSSSMMPSPGVWSSGRGPMMQQHQGGEQNKQGQGDGGIDTKSSPSPRMMSFKKFLLAQEENIDEVESVRRYQEYKTEFRRTQLSDFFVLHKDEEWFKNKYHPIDAKQRAKEHRNGLRKRLRIFLDLLESGYTDNLSLDGDNSDEIVKMLDAVAVKLEGGTIEDLATLDPEKHDTEEAKQRCESTPAVNQAEEGKTKEKEKETVVKQDDEPELSLSSVPLPDEPPPQNEAIDDKADEASETDKAEKKKKKRTSSEDANEADKGSESEASGSESEVEPAPPGEDNVLIEADSQNEVKVEKSNEDEKPAAEKQDSVDDSVPNAADETPLQAEEDGEPDPGPPGVDEESDRAKDSAASNDGGASTKDDSSADKEKADVSGDEEKKAKGLGKGLGAYLAMMKSESNEQPQESKDEQSNDDQTEKKEKEERKTRKRDWEGRKGTGLEAFVARMGGEANEDSDSESDSESEEEEEEEDDEEENETSSVQQAAPEARRDSEMNGEKRDIHDEATDSKEHDQEERLLHKTLSLFMRNVPPNISKADISAVCKRYPGYLRVALADPNPERGFYRRGWVTFENIVNIKDICWNLSNIRIKDSELNPVVNRDLSKRIRPISGITLCKQIVRFDIKLSAKLVKVLDDKFALYSKDMDDEENNENDMVIEESTVATEDVEEDGGKDVQDEDQAGKSGAVQTKKAPKRIPEESPLPEENPVLAALPQTATESAEGEEMELIGDKEAEAKENEVDFTRDENLMKALDRLVLYLRIVHSLDYYNCSDYPYEDEMPNRCGILHVRGTVPEKAAQADVAEWQKNVEHKLAQFLEKEEEALPDAEVQKLGKKDVDEEVENFMRANTQELAKDKWLCPLSGKKFRAKEFVRKHILNKHADKLEAVKLEVDFFNKYLSDRKRPQFNDFKPSGSSSSGQHGYQQQMNYQMGWGPRGHGMMYGGPRVPCTPPAYGGFSSGPEMYNRGGMTYPPKPSRAGASQRDSRKVVEYKDLDAPDDMDFF